MSAKEREKKALNNHKNHPGQPSERSQRWFYSETRKRALRKRQSRCPHLNQSLAKWNKQFSSCSSPGPIWLWCYLGSEGEKKKAFVIFLKRFLPITTILSFKTVEKLQNLLLQCPKNLYLLLWLSSQHLQKVNSVLMRNKALLSSCVILPHFKHSLNVSRSSQNSHFPARELQLLWGTKSCTSGREGGLWNEKLEHKKVSSSQVFQALQSPHCEDVPLLSPSQSWFPSAATSKLQSKFQFWFISPLLCCDSMFDPPPGLVRSPSKGKSHSFYLRFLEFLVIICLKLDQRTKYILVLISIFVSKQDMLGFLINTRFFQVLQGCRWIFLEIKAEMFCFKVWSVKKNWQQDR